MINLIGAFCFGLVMGWLTYRTLARKKTSSLGDLTIVLGTLGGATIVSIFPTAEAAFGAYCIGLAIGFFLYLFTFYKLEKAAVEGDEAAAKTRGVLGDEKSKY